MILAHPSPPPVMNMSAISVRRREFLPLSDMTSVALHRVLLIGTPSVMTSAPQCDLPTSTISDVESGPRMIVVVLVASDLVAIVYAPSMTTTPSEGDGRPNFKAIGSREGSSPMTIPCRGWIVDLVVATSHI
jgi:hypothetical protein